MMTISYGLLSYLSQLDTAYSYSQYIEQNEALVCPDDANPLLWLLA